MESAMENAHPDYRLFISAEPAAAAGKKLFLIIVFMKFKLNTFLEYHIIPQGILESAIKITNEPPTGNLNYNIFLKNFNVTFLQNRHECKHA